jgi:hypothetical protein
VVVAIDIDQAKADLIIANRITTNLQDVPDRIW